MKKTNELVTVLMPVYNVNSFINESLQSIIEQSYKNIEIVIVDDGSTDGTYSTLKELLKSDDRIKLVRNNNNKKIAKALNNGLAIATGEYIVRMDGDDISEPDRIEKLLEFIKNNPEYDIVGSSMTAINESGDEVFKTTYSNNEKFLIRSLKYSSPLAHIWITKKSVYDDLDGYRELSGAEDYDFLLRAISRGYRITNLKKYYGYRVRINRTGNTASLMGIKQIKLHSYVWRLYKERKRVGIDNFSVTKVSKVLSTNPFIENLHKRSNIYLNLAIKNKSKPLIALPYLILSCISPYQVQYLIRRLMLRLLNKMDNHA